MNKSRPERDFYRPPERPRTSGFPSQYDEPTVKAWIKNHIVRIPGERINPEDPRFMMRLTSLRSQVLNTCMEMARSGKSHDEINRYLATIRISQRI